MVGGGRETAKVATLQIVVRIDLEVCQFAKVVIGRGILHWHHGKGCFPPWETHAQGFWVKSGCAALVGAKFLVVQVPGSLDCMGIILFTHLSFHFRLCSLGIRKLSRKTDP